MRNLFITLSRFSGKCGLSGLCMGPQNYIFQCAFSCKLSSAFFIILSNLVSNQGKRKNLAERLLIIFTKSIRLRVKKTCTLRKLNRCRFRTSPLLIKGEGRGVFYAGEGNFNIKGYKRSYFSTLIHQLVGLHWIYLTT